MQHCWVDVRKPIPTLFGDKFAVNYQWRVGPVSDLAVLNHSSTSTEHVHFDSKRVKKDFQVPQSLLKEECIFVQLVSGPEN